MGGFRRRNIDNTVSFDVMLFSKLLFPIKKCLQQVCWYFYSPEHNLTASSHPTRSRSCFVMEPGHRSTLSAELPRFKPVALQLLCSQPPPLPLNHHHHQKGKLTHLQMLCLQGKKKPSDSLLSPLFKLINA